MLIFKGSSEYTFEKLFVQLAHGYELLQDFEELTDLDFTPRAVRITATTASTAAIGTDPCKPRSLVAKQFSLNGCQQATNQDAKVFDSLDHFTDISMLLVFLDHTSI